MTKSDLLLELRKAFPLSWRMVRRCRLPAGTMDEPYYVSFEPGGGLYGERWNRFDENGVLFKGAYHPVSIAQYALYCYERLHAGDTSAREPFLRQVEYLARAQQPDGTYPYPFAHPAYDLEPGWISGLAQAEAFSLFIRAFAVTQRDEYLDRARAALGSFEREAGARGITFTNARDVFFEEMPGRPTHILNGHLSAGFAAWEAERYGFASRTLRELHEASIETLVRWLPYFDDDGWSFYQLAVRGDAKRRYVPITYHQSHINLLRVYAAMTGRREFEEMSARWLRGLNRWDVRARVWRDSSEWVLDTAVRRLRKTPAGPWRWLVADDAPVS